jgi:serralysin
MRIYFAVILLLSIAVDAKAQKVVQLNAVGEIGAAEVPGPSAALFANPPYQCIRNFYVSTTGSDAAAGTQTAPWKSLRRADTSDRTGGDCINVSPGTYSAGLNVKHGGNLASPRGYVVYRCQVLDACKITATGGNGDPAFTFNTTGGPNYVMIDGFELAARSQVAYGSGIYISDNGTGGPTTARSAHHVWILNNIIHGYGNAGIGTNRNDWTLILHNTVYDNARVTCDAQGSGIGIVVPAVTPNYTLTADDKKWAPFHQIVSWNVAYDNALTRCGNANAAYNTDGNGIIIDTFNGAGVNDVPYPDQTLVANNVVYGNGGKGIQVFRSSYVTVANNTAYNNNLDPWNAGFPRGEISNSGGTSNAYLNNIAYTIPATSKSDPRCQGASYDIAPAPCPLMANVAFFGGGSAGVTDVGNSWSNNISFGGAPPWGWGPQGNVMLGHDTMSCTSNKCNANPLLSDPSGNNFALTSGSPAIGYGQSQPFLAPHAVDAGACHRSVVRCP